MARNLTPAMLFAQRLRLLWSLGKNIRRRFVIAMSRQPSRFEEEFDYMVVESGHPLWELGMA